MSQTSDLPIPETVEHQDPEAFLAPSADKQTGEGDIYGATGVHRDSPKCSNCEQLALHCATVCASERDSPLVLVVVNP